MSLNRWNIDLSWSLFLDRDGVINHRLPGDYVKSLEEFSFIQGVPEAIAIFSKMFSKVIVVTNQQGVAKGLMSAETLHRIHQFMVSEIEKTGGRIDLTLFAPHLESENNIMRKPNIGMALKAKRSFPDLRFRKSIMVGDSVGDMLFGKRVGMKTVLISNDSTLARNFHKIVDMQCSSLHELAEQLIVNNFSH